MIVVRAAETPNIPLSLAPVGGADNLDQAGSVDNKWITPVENPPTCGSVFSALWRKEFYKESKYKPVSFGAPLQTDGRAGGGG
jgi:hypothetical protein